ncbi:MAG TPA: hypothetical protein VFF87_12625 [Hyphomicrobium sp.]|nr:hypothetical protein [Hyphomicrobium sp.]
MTVGGATMDGAGASASWNAAKPLQIGQLEAGACGFDVPAALSPSVLQSVCAAKP